MDPDQVNADEATVPHVERWEQVLEQDLNGLQSWLEDRVTAAGRRRMGVFVQAVYEHGRTPMKIRFVDGRRGRLVLPTARRVLAGALMELPSPHAGELVVGVLPIGALTPDWFYATLLVGPQDRLRRSPAAREWARIARQMSRQQAATHQTLLETVQGSSAMLRGAAHVVDATRGLNLGAPDGPPPPPSEYDRPKEDLLRHGLSLLVNSSERLRESAPHVAVSPEPERPRDTAAEDAEPYPYAAELGGRWVVADDDLAEADDAHHAADPEGERADAEPPAHEPASAAPSSELWGDSE